jgi:hypothetical protein
MPTCHWLQGKCARIYLTGGFPVMILQNHRRLPESIFSVKIAALGVLKGVAGKILQVISKGTSLNFEFDFFVN